PGHHQYRRRLNRSACRKGERLRCCFALARKCRLRELQEKEKQNEAESFSCCPPLPHAREPEGCPAREQDRAGCRLRRSPGLAVGTVRAAFPRQHPFRMRRLERTAAVVCELFKRPQE